MKSHLAQLNIARMTDPMDSPVMAEFVDNLDRINAAADEAPGFVWRLETEEGDATALRPLGPTTLVNLSVWQDVDSLRAFVYQSSHAGIMKRRREWFERMAEPFMVLWWVPCGHRPTIEEALGRLEVLRSRGPTARAFDFRHPFPESDSKPTDRAQ